MVELTFLGTGTSNGIPVIGCHCPVCTSADPRDRRGRTSAVVSFDGRSILIDTSPELRLQAIHVGLERIDAVLYTHAHADHVAGLDELRRFNEINQAYLPVFADPQTAARNLITEVPHPAFGTARWIASPVRVGDPPAQHRRAPELGEHTEAVLRDVLGYDNAKMQSHRDAGAFGGPHPATTNEASPL